MVSPLAVQRSARIRALQPRIAEAAASWVGMYNGGEDADPKAEWKALETIQFFTLNTFSSLILLICLFLPVNVHKL
jgi:hypothetical protein